MQVTTAKIEKITILFPSDYSDRKKVEPDYSDEYEAVCKVRGLQPLLLDYDSFVQNGSLKLFSPRDSCTGDCIYRGWMLTPEQYKTLYRSLQEKGITLINTPDEYDTCHLFPLAKKHLFRKTPPSLIFEKGKQIHWDAVNKSFKKFMIKDYVKSVKGTGFPECFETPVVAKEMNARIAEFIERRGELFTGGIVIKEYVDLAKYGDCTNEYRAFFLNGQLLSLHRNSGQPESCQSPPSEFVSGFGGIPSNYCTVDFAELSDGGWIAVETGDGQVSGLSAGQSADKYFGDVRRVLNNETESRDFGALNRDI
jgi:hypothetical protein